MPYMQLIRNNRTAGHPLMAGDCSSHFHFGISCEPD
jgi:hypothetical protein